MTKLCLSVLDYEQFLMEAKAKHGTSDEYTKIRTKFHESITRDHFTSNENLIEFLKPVAELIGNTKSPSSTLAHIFVEWLKLYIKLINLNKTTNPLTQKPFIDHDFDRFNIQFT